MSEELCETKSAGYYEGVKAGIRLYAWWRDGVQYVGTCGWTLERALADVGREAAQALPAASITKDELREALKAARHELTTLHGLYATDKIDIYGDEIYEGAEPHKAWDAQMKATWRIDTLTCVNKIDRALATAGVSPAAPTIEGTEEQ